MLQVSEYWTEKFPGASVGLMVLSQVENPENCEALEAARMQIEAEIGRKFADRKAVLEHPPIKAYNAYYKLFDKTYHVQHQLESVGYKGKTIPRSAGLVEAMFMAELKNGLLTAGHDYQALQLPLKLQVASGDEQYILINGKPQRTKPGDMMITDGKGVISSVIYGPDLRTRIVAGTKAVAFMVYAPSGISSAAVEGHLADIYSFVRRVAPTVKIEVQQICR